MLSEEVFVVFLFADTFLIVGIFKFLTILTMTFSTEQMNVFKFSTVVLKEFTVTLRQYLKALYLLIQGTGAASHCL